MRVYSYLSCRSSCSSRGGVSLGPTPMTALYKQLVIINAISNAVHCHPSQANPKLLCSLLSTTWHSSVHDLALGCQHNLCNVPYNTCQTSLNLVLQISFCAVMWKQKLVHHNLVPRPSLHATQLLWATFPDAFVSIVCNWQADKLSTHDDNPGLP